MTKFSIGVATIKEQNGKVGSFQAADNGVGIIGMIESMSDGKFVKMTVPGFAKSGDNFMMNSAQAAAILFNTGMVEVERTAGKEPKATKKAGADTAAKPTFRDVLADPTVTGFTFTIITSKVQLKADQKGQNIKATVL